MMSNSNYSIGLRLNPVHTPFKLTRFY